MHVKPHDNLSLRTHGRSWLPPFPVLCPGTTRVHSAHLCYTLSDTDGPSGAEGKRTVMSLHRPTVHEQEAREGAREASPKRLERAEERVWLYEQAQHVNSL
jgi:hypothetical protein